MPQSEGKNIWTQSLRAHISSLHKREDPMPFQAQFPDLLIIHLIKEKYLIIPAPPVFVSSLRTAISVPATKNQPTKKN